MSGLIECGVAIGIWRRLVRCRTRYRPAPRHFSQAEISSLDLRPETLADSGPGNDGFGGTLGGRNVEMLKWSRRRWKVGCAIWLSARAKKMGKHDLFWQWLAKVSNKAGLMECS
jgi:hypothetical protein